MKKIIPLLTGIIFCNLTIAQNPYLTDYRHAFKINNLSSLSYTYPSSSNVSSVSIFRNGPSTAHFQLFHPTFAFDWQSKRNSNTHELELVDLILNRENLKEYASDSLSTKLYTKSLQTAISLRYEYKINFHTKKESRWVPSIGLSVNPYYRNFHSITNFRSQKSNVQTIGARLAVNPSITYFFTKKLFMTAGLSLTLIDYSRSDYSYSDLGQQIKQNRSQLNYGLKSITDLLEFRVGIGYKF